ncbi:MAG: transposase, partial [Pseudomonadota bacterium]
MAKKQFRKKLGIPGLLASLRKDLSKIRDPKSGTEIPLVDCLMSGLAVFQLKYPSLLQFEKAKFSKQIQANLRNLYGVTRSP